MMLKASPEAAIRTSFEGEVAERKNRAAPVFQLLALVDRFGRYFTPKPIAVPLKNTGLWEGGS